VQIAALDRPVKRMVREQDAEKPPAQKAAV